MDDKKKGKTNSKWIILGVVMSIILVISVFATIYIVNIGNGVGISYTWSDRSSGECEVVEGTYHGKADTLYLNDDRIDEFCSARFSYESLTDGVISFNFRFDSDVSGDIVMQFYEGNLIFSELSSMHVSLVSDTWYLVDLKFDCETNTGEVWIDGFFYTSGSFTIAEADYNDGFVIKTDTSGMINAYLNMISII